MPLTAAHIQKALSAVGALGGQMKPAAELASGANTALAQAPSGLTKEGAAAFLATMAQESAYFRTTTEYGSARKRYDPYRGRTFEQVTWRENYAAFGKWCKAKGLLTDADYFVDNPTRLSDYKWAWLGGVWYFQHANLWRYANAGNFKAVSQGVNGGTGRIGTSFTPNGWVHRLAMYEAFLLAGSALLPDGKAAPAKPKPKPKSTTLATDGLAGPKTWERARTLVRASKDRWLVLWIQEQLNERGYRDKRGRRLAEDGYGLTSNVGGRTRETNTCYAFSLAMGIRNPDGAFDRPSDAVREWQRRLNSGRVI